MTHPRSFSSNGVRRTAHRSDAANWRSGATAARSGGYQAAHASNNSSSPPSGSRHPSEDDEFGGNRGGAHDNPVHGRLLFLTMCLVGQFVEVQLKDGSVYSGIFHTANVDTEFGVVLKMARLTKEATGKAGKTEAVKQAAKRPPMKLLIVYAKDLVQIVAKEVLLTGEAFPNGRSKENKNELLTDSFISHNRRDTERERELKPWTPDGEPPRNLGLENTFQNPWNRNWDQFQTNKELFGVETTFNEELYTTKLGPQTRDREREASRLAREIGDSTRKFSTEDRVGSDAELDNLDEESRYSSVLRPRNYEDEGDDDGDDKLDDFNDQTFGSATMHSDTFESSSHHGLVGSPRSSASAGDTGLLSSTGPASNELPRESKILENAKKAKKDQVNDLKHIAESFKDRPVKNFDGRLAKSSSTAAKLADDTKDKQAQASISPPPASALPIPVVLNAPGAAARSPTIVAAPAPSEVPRATSLDSASTSSGGAEAGVKKSSLNPHAKEFKLNPNAKVFTPTYTPQRPASPVNQPTAIYVPTAVPINPMQGMPVGMGFMPQPGQPAQFAQYNTMPATGVTAAPYIQPSPPFVPGGAVPPVKGPPQAQPQGTPAPYGQPPARYMAPMQATPTYHNYPQPVMYGHQLLFYSPQPQYPQGMIQGQPVIPMPPQPSPQLSQPQKHPGGGESSGHHNGPNVVVGHSPAQSPLPSPAPRSQPPAAAAAAAAAAQPSSAVSSSGGGKPGPNGAPRGNKN